MTQIIVSIQEIFGKIEISVNAIDVFSDIHDVSYEESRAKSDIEDIIKEAAQAWLEAHKEEI